MLSIVSTPVGHLEDMTYRAVRTLQEADVIACEDTRTTGVLLRHYSITTPTMSYHSHSGDDRIDQIVARLRQGQHVALVSDAGTPGISDPGYALIHRVVAEGLDVSPIPGASAVLPALVASGLDTHHFLYVGFLPVKKWRKTLLTHLATLPYTVVLYESVHRILRTLDELGQYLGEDRPICIGREITKKFEEFTRGTIRECREHFTKKSPKGEFVVVIGRPDRERKKDGEDDGEE